MEVFAVPPHELILSPVLTVWRPHNQFSVLFAASTCVRIVWPITQSNVIKTRVHQHSTGVITVIPWRDFSAPFAKNRPGKGQSKYRPYQGQRMRL